MVENKKVRFKKKVDIIKKCPKVNMDEKIKNIKVKKKKKKKKKEKVYKPHDVDLSFLDDMIIYEYEIC
jgi:hypothetical protein